MPAGPIPERFHDILRSTTLGHLATVDEHGRPQVNPVWFLWDGESILLSVRPVTQKYKNLRRDPHVAISFLDPANPMRYVELRGEVAEWQLFEDLTFVNRLARKYTGADFTGGRPGEHRYRLTIRVDAWTGQ
ncbi:MAG TPA: PPOX class F420-dependent oxidoreductase [Thermomicrobiales bacterium]|jgi:PPOX class probable F420-dependent enzyme